MYLGYKKIFWGLIFITFHINLGTLEIIPSFIGFIFILTGIITINDNRKNNVNKKEKYENLSLANKFTKILICISFFLFIAKLFNIQIGFTSILIASLVMFLEMIMIYNILQGSVVILKDNNQFEEIEKMDKYISKYILIQTIAILLSNLFIIVPSSTLIIVTAILSIVIRIWIMFIISELQKTFEDIN